MHSHRGTSACYVIHIQGNVSKVQPPSTHHVILSNRKCACLLQESQTSETLHCIGWGERGVPDGICVWSGASCIPSFGPSLCEVESLQSVPGVAGCSADVAS